MKLLSIQNSPLKAIVDDEDYERLSKFVWYAQKSGAIKRSTYDASFAKTIDTSLASEIMNKPGQLYDHKDNNPLNNSKTNLRPCTVAQNCYNTKKRKGCSSPYKGVCWAKEKQKWLASIAQFNVSYHIGYFETENKAAEEYNRFAKEYFGEFAKLNTINYEFQRTHVSQPAPPTGD